MLIDAATRTNLELTATLSGEPEGQPHRGDRPHRHRRRRAPPGAAACEPLDRSGDHRPAPRRASPGCSPTAGRRAGDPRRARAAPGPRPGARPLAAQPRRPARPRRHRATASAAPSQCRRARSTARPTCRTSSPPPRPRLPAAPPASRPRSTPRSPTTLPHLKRDGGFVRDGYRAELDEALTAPRRQPAGHRRHCRRPMPPRPTSARSRSSTTTCSATSSRSAPTRRRADCWRRRSNARFIHRQTLANAYRFTTTELADLEAKIAGAADRALAIELAVFDALAAAVVAAADPIRAVAEALARHRRRRRAGDARRGRETIAGRWSRTRSPSPSSAAAIRSSSRRSAAMRPPAPSSPMIAISAGRRRGRADLAGDRAEHGRQVDLPAPERADRHPRPDRRPTCRRSRRGSASSTACSAGSARPTTSPAAARPSWSRWSRRRRS